MSTSDGNRGIVTPYEGSAARSWDPAAPIDAPLRVHQTNVPADWVDYNGHLSESCYLLAFGDNSDAFFRYVGIDEQYRAAGSSLYTVETHLHNLREAGTGERLSFSLQLLDVDAKRLHVFHTMHHGDSGDLLATAEQMLLHVDTTEGKAVPMPSWLLDRVSAIHAAHAELPLPPQVGHVIGIPSKPRGQSGGEPI